MCGVYKLSTLLSNFYRWCMQMARNVTQLSAGASALCRSLTWRSAIQHAERCRYYPGGCCGSRQPEMAISNKKRKHTGILGSFMQ